MMKEIHEQPQAVRSTLASCLKEDGIDFRDAACLAGDLPEEKGTAAVRQHPGSGSGKL